LVSDDFALLPSLLLSFALLFLLGIFNLEKKPPDGGILNFQS